MEGTSLDLTYTEPLDASSVPLPGAYSVTVDGTAAAPSSVSVSGKTVTLTLAPAVITGQDVTVTYTAGSTPVQDGSGLDALPLTGEEVDNTTPPIPASAEVPPDGSRPHPHLHRGPRHRGGQAPPGECLHRQGR